MTKFNRLYALLQAILCFGLVACIPQSQPETATATPAKVAEVTVANGQATTLLLPTQQPTQIATAQPTAQPTQAAPPTPTVPPSPTPASEITGAANAVIRIVAEGSFSDPYAGEQSNVSGSGSGFIISPDGIAVTNNHVVAGAAILRVYINGEKEPRNARVLGVSECSDLAVIDIDGGDFAFLDWYRDELTVGTEVFAAGYPLGETEFTLTRGIISKSSTNGDTQWASVDSVLEHDATINRGSSGGPLINREGQVIGINFAGRFSTNQYFAIAYAEIARVVTTLTAGEDMTSIGISGTTLLPEEGGPGLWVSSVDSGSAADRAGVENGDLIYSLEGLQLGLDGTMADYCDVLRTNTADDTLNITVLRPDGVYSGQINGDELALETPTAPVAIQNIAPDQDQPVSTTPENSAETLTLIDDTRILSIAAPSGWQEMDGSIPNSDLYSAQLVFGPALAGFQDSWAGPGMSIAYTTYQDVSITQFLDFYNELYVDQCDYDDRYDFDGGDLVGEYDFFEGCNGTTQLAVLALHNAAEGYYLLVQMQYLTDAELEILAASLVSIQVTP